MSVLTIQGIFKWASAMSLAVLAACSTVDVSTAPPFSATDGLAVLPIANFTETPEAGQRAGSIAQSILYQKGFGELRPYPRNEGMDLLMAGNAERVRSEGLEWARSMGMRYALTGAVQEWRYKVGLDGEPVVGVTFNLVDVSSGAVVWSATGSRSGWSRSSLSGVGQTLIRDLLAPLTPQ